MLPDNHVAFNSLHNVYEHFSKLWCIMLYQSVGWETGNRSSKIMRLDMKGFCPYMAKVETLRVVVVCVLFLNHPILHTHVLCWQHSCNYPCEKHLFLIVFSVLIKHIWPMRQGHSGWMGPWLQLIYTGRRDMWQAVYLNMGHHLLSCCKQRLPFLTIQSALHRKYLCCLSPLSVCAPLQLNFNADSTQGVLLVLEILAISLQCLFSTPTCCYIPVSFLWLQCSAWPGNREYKWKTVPWS